ncbi:MAG: cell division protein SepF [Acidimicrobiia bacterium]|nr:cell division protein SepF [Acidimicrobiia bacterium]
MASLWQKTMFYLGLVDDEQIEAAEAAAEEAQPTVRTVDSPQPAERSQPTRVGRTSGAVAGRRVEPPAPMRRRVSENADHAEAGVLVTAGSGSSRAGGPAVASEREAAIIEARTLADAQTLADYIREGQPVVLDLRETETAMVRRLVDFSSGLTYALDGRMVKVATGVILVTPHGSSISVEERRRLAALGLYDAAPGS